jgi:cystinosin
MQKLRGFYANNVDFVHRVCGTLLVIVLGVVLGFTTPIASDLQSTSCGSTCGYISNVIGWIYFAAWSLSFYPQLILNYRRKSVVGMSFDYQVYNVIGFGCYSVFNAMMYWSPTVQQEYRDQNDGNNNQVQTSDVFFPIHGFVITILIVAQIGIYERGNQSISKYCYVISSLFLVGIVIYLILYLKLSGKNFNLLAFVTFLSYIKIAISCIKYTPQCYLNFKRKSTVGCNIDNFLLDFVGGSLSVAQLIMDAELTSDWSAVTGDAAKFVLGLMSMVFDIIFFIQHYGLYTDRFDPNLQKNEYEPLQNTD